MYIPDRYKAVQGKAKPQPKGALLDIYDESAKEKAKQQEGAPDEAQVRPTLAK